MTLWARRSGSASQVHLLRVPVRFFPLFQQGYDPQFGARPLKRAIQRLIQDPLAMKLLDGEITPGDSLTIDADVKKGEMTFKPAKTKAAKQA